MIIPVGFAHVTHIFTSGFLPTGAVTTYAVDHAGSGGGAFDIAENCYNAFQDQIMGSLHTSLNHVACLVKMGPNDTGASSEFTGSGGGGEGGEAAPPNLCYLIEKQTALGGRQGRGRMFLPGVTEAGTDGSGAISSAILAGFVVQLPLFIADLNTAGLEMVVLHSTSLAPTPVTALSCDPVAATQRERMRR